MPSAVASSEAAVPPVNGPAPAPDTEQIKSLVREVGALAAPPHVYLKVWELLQSSESSAKDFERVIGLDPSLTVRLLRIANSSFYNLRGRVDTVSRAVSVIGTRELFTLIVAVSAVKSFSKITSDLVNMDTFWRHSVFTGLVAKLLADQCDVLRAERLFVAGLLHDVGALVMFNRLPDVERDFLEAAAGDEDKLYALELEVLGFTHAHVAGVLLEKWQVPDALRGAVMGHHDPLSVQEGMLEAALVHVANTIANRSAIGSFYESGVIDEQPPISDTLWGSIGLQANDVEVESLIAQASEQFIETMASLGLSVGE